MIAFDFDGVFIPDIVFTEEIGALKEPNRTEVVKKLIKEISDVSMPLFQPDYPYWIITSRYKYNYIDTMKVIKRMNPSKQPERIFHENTIPGYTAIYKLKVLEASKCIDLFIESSRCHVDYLKQNLKRKDIEIIHFSKWINKSLIILNK